MILRHPTHARIDVRKFVLMAKREKVSGFESRFASGIEHLSYALVLEASALDGGGGIFVCVETRALALTLLSALALELVVRCASFHCRAADEPTLLEYFVGAAGSINSWSILAWPLDELRCPVSGLPETLTSSR